MMEKENFVYYLSKRILQNGDYSYIGLGSVNFTPLEFTLKSEITDDLEFGEKLYIGDGNREKVKSIIGRCNSSCFENLDQRALQTIVELVISDNENKFVDFFNTAGAYSVKRHYLTLVPGIGFKLLDFFLKERELKKFESIKDIEQRCNENKIPFIPLNSISKRVLMELSGKTDEKIFVK